MFMVTLKLIWTVSIKMKPTAGRKQCGAYISEAAVDQMEHILQVG